ncbi:ester cyclase (plasmid) [Rhizobium leguminosarum]
MSITDNNKALVARFYEAFNTDNADIFRTILSPVWTDHPEAPGQIPGPEGLIGVVGTFRKAFEGLHITPEQVVAEADHVVVRIRLEGHHIKDFYGHAPSGKHAVFHGMDMHRIENGAIAETWHFEDFSSLVT